MNYKAISLVLLIALIAMVAYHFSTLENDDTGMEQVVSSNDDQKLTDYFSKIMGNRVDSTLGKFISFEAGKSKLDSMLSYRRRNPGNPKIRNSYGYLFGIEKIRTLVAKIDHINKVQDSVHLTGIRVYRTISKAKGRKYFDVFMIAVTDENKDYPNLRNPDLPKDYLDDEPPILNFSMPCPENCD